MANEPGLEKLTAAIDWVEKHHPLPRCNHGHALRDAAGEKLEPGCGCRLLLLDPDFRRDAPESSPYCARCQRPVNPKTAISVTVDWNTWIVQEGGEEFVGPDCWKAILEASR